MQKWEYGWKLRCGFKQDPNIPQDSLCGLASVSCFPDLISWGAVSTFLPHAVGGPFISSKQSLVLPNSHGGAFLFYLSLKCPLIRGISRPLS